MYGILGDTLTLPILGAFLTEEKRVELCPGVGIEPLSAVYAARLKAQPELSARYTRSIDSMRAGVVLDKKIIDPQRALALAGLLDVARLAAMSIRLATGIPVDIPFYFDVQEDELLGVGNTQIKTFRLEPEYRYPLDDGPQLEGIQALQKGYQSILDAQLQDKTKHVLLRALKFAAIGFETKHINVRLINNTVFLESLFSTSETEIAFQIAARVSWYLEPDDATDARVQLFTEIKKLYGYRSKIVHGATVSENNKNLRQMLLFSEILNTRIFRQILNAGQVHLFAESQKTREEKLRNLTLGVKNALY